MAVCVLGIFLVQSVIVFKRCWFLEDGSRRRNRVIWVLNLFYDLELQVGFNSIIVFTS